ncbi:hypothetical protein OG795_32200 [[Kitasatospora] papulosa]|uniref:hypothetical protein n=1 Tax=[Kitasatospora] papulosa TaxID=1464011 RepID=UPI003253A09E
MSRLLAKPKCPRRAKTRLARSRPGAMRPVRLTRSRRSASVRPQPPLTRLVRRWRARTAGWSRRPGGVKRAATGAAPRPLIAEAGMVVATWSADLTDQNVVATQRPGAPTDALDLSNRLSGV